jgi:hypothetical protein
MEPPTHFDLEQAIAAWRQELASHPGPAPDDVRALEAHLRDGFAELKGNRLSDEEAFLVARHRVGPPRAVAGEFAKEASKHGWKQWAFWGALGLFAMQFWFRVLACLWLPLLRFLAVSFSWPWADLRHDPVVYRVIFPALFSLLLFGVPAMLAVLLIVTGMYRSVARMFSNRVRVAVMSTGLYFALCFIPLWSNLFYNLVSVNGELPPFFYFIARFLAPYLTMPRLGDLVIAYYLWPLIPVGVMIWLAPGRVKARTRAAMAGRA